MMSKWCQNDYKQCMKHKLNITSFIMMVVIWSCYIRIHSCAPQVVGVLTLMLQAMGWSYDYCNYIILYYLFLNIHNKYEIYYNLCNSCKI